MTYTAVNAPFLVLSLVLAIAAVAVIVRRRVPGGLRRWSLGVGIALVALFVLTTVFDNVIILTGVVDYDHSLTSGIRIGVAPIEDFAYSLAAGIALPSVWALVPGRRRSTGRRAP